MRLACGGTWNGCKSCFLEDQALTNLEFGLWSMRDSADQMDEIRARAGLERGHEREPRLECKERSKPWNGVTSLEFGVPASAGPFCRLHFRGKRDAVPALQASGLTV